MSVPLTTSIIIGGARSDIEKSVVNANIGSSSSHVITTEERAKFGLSLDVLKSTSTHLWGRPANKAYVKNGDGKDLHKEYNWEEVKTTVTTVSAVIVEAASIPTVFDFTLLENDSSIEGEYSTDLEESYSHSASTTWSSSTTVGQEQKFNFEIEIPEVAKVGTEATIKLETTCGVDKSEERSSGIAKTYKYSAKLAPGMKQKVNLTGYKGSVKVRVTYKATLSGLVAVWYTKQCNGHWFYGYDVNTALEHCNLPKEIFFDAVIDVANYSHGEIRPVDA